MQNTLLIYKKKDRSLTNKSSLSRDLGGLRYKGFPFPSTLSLLSLSPSIETVNSLFPSFVRNSTKLPATYTRTTHRGI